MTRNGHSTKVALSSGCPSFHAPAPPPTTSYVGRVVELPLLTASAAFDAALRTTGERFAPGHGGTAGCVRSRYGTLLGPRPWAPLAVELTLDRWDTRRCEVGLRPRRVLYPSVRRANWYFRTAAALLDELVVAMQDWAVTSPWEIPTSPGDRADSRRGSRGPRRLGLVGRPWSAT